MHWLRHPASVLAAVAAGLAVMMLPITPSHGENAVSVGGDANGTIVAVGTNSANSSGGVAVAGTGAANGNKGAVSGLGTATSGAGGVAVSGANNAYGNGGVVVSGDGRSYNSSSSGASVSGTKQAHGGVAPVSAGRFIVNTGLLDAPNTVEAALVPTTDTVNPVDTANKMIELARVEPSVAYNMATGATSGLTAPMSSTSSNPCPDGTCRRVPMAYTHNQALQAQLEWWWCVPASVQMFLQSSGGTVPSQAQLAQELRTRAPERGRDTADPRAGTPTANAAPVINRFRPNGDRIINQRNRDAKQLMSRVTAAAYSYRHAVILSTNPSHLPTWSGNGTAHAIVAHGWDHRGGGWIYIMDPYDMYRFNWTDESWGGPNPFGSKKIRLAHVWAANEARNSLITW